MQPFHPKKPEAKCRSWDLQERLMWLWGSPPQTLRSAQGPLMSSRPTSSPTVLSALLLLVALETPQPPYVLISFSSLYPSIHHPGLLTSQSFLHLSHSLIHTRFLSDGRDDRLMRDLLFTSVTSHVSAMWEWFSRFRFSVTPKTLPCTN